MTSGVREFRYEAVLEVASVVSPSQRIACARLVQLPEQLLLPFLDQGETKVHVGTNAHQGAIRELASRDAVPCNVGTVLGIEILDKVLLANLRDCCMLSAHTRVVQHDPRGRVPPNRGREALERRHFTGVHAIQTHQNRTIDRLAWKELVRPIIAGCGWGRDGGVRFVVTESVITDLSIAETRADGWVRATRWHRDERPTCGASLFRDRSELCFSS